MLLMVLRGTFCWLAFSFSRELQRVSTRSTDAQDLELLACVVSWLFVGWGLGAFVWGLLGDGCWIRDKGGFGLGDSGCISM